MATFLKSELESLGVKVTLVELGKQMLDGEEVQLPPAILGEIGNDKSKKTVGLYAHYDVQPVRIPHHSFTAESMWWAMIRCADILGGRIVIK